MKRKLRPLTQAGPYLRIVGLALATFAISGLYSTAQANSGEPPEKRQLTTSPQATSKMAPQQEIFLVIPNKRQIEKQNEGITPKRKAVLGERTGYHLSDEDLPQEK